MTLQQGKVKLSVNGGDINVQNPLPVDGDSVYTKDIDVSRSDIGDFTGAVTYPFDDLHSENVNSTPNSIKSFSIHFNRSIITNFIGIGSSEGGSFSNVKVIGLLSGAFEAVLADYSLDNSLRTTQTIIFPNSGLNALRIEFHTTNSVAITNIFIPKLRSVSAVISNTIVYADSYMSPYLLNGASQNMAVDGSGTSVDFKYTVSGLNSAKWRRSFIDLEDGAQEFLPENFGAIAGGLANGVDVIVVKDGSEIIIENWKNNMDISMTCYDFNNPYKVGAYIGRWTISSDLGEPITLFPDDEIILRINDDLTGLDSFRFRLKLRQ